MPQTKSEPASALASSNNFGARSVKGLPRANFDTCHNKTTWAQNQTETQNSAD